MFIFNRLIGISIYVMTLIIICLFIRYSKKSNIKYFLFIYFILLCLMAFFYEPYETSDLYRIREYANALSQYSLENFISIIFNQNTPLASTPLAMIYYRILGQLGDLRWISCVSCAIIYFFIFKMIYEITIKYNISSQTVAIVLFLIMSMDYFMPCIATIRSYISCILVAYNIYREIFKGKFSLINILFYLVSIFMHSIGIALVLFRLGCFNFIECKSIKLKMIVCMITMMFLIRFSFITKILANASQILKSYLFNNIYFYVWEVIICFMCFLILIYILFKAKKFHTFLLINKTNYRIIVKVLMILFLLSFVQFTFMQRLSFFCTVIMIPILLITLNDDKYVKKIRTRQILMFCSLVILILVCSRGYLCSLKFF